MSETGRKMDVEDVLSSIRRLVSEEARTASDAENADTNAPKADEDLLQQSNAGERDKLVLTPSLRVAESENPTPAPSELEQRIADIESLVMSEAVDHAADEVAQNVDVQEIEEIESEMGDDTADFAEMVEDVTEQVTEEVSADATSEMMSALHLSMKDFARAEPPITANLSGAPSIEEPEENSLMDAVNEADFQDIEASDADNEAPSDSPFAADLDDVHPEPEFMQTMNDDADADAGLDDVEQDITPERDTIITREPPLRAPEPEPAASADSTLFEEPFESAMGYTDQDNFLDEETLREMVSDMVRSELQGELGDRITRNVRKLVRREIHRALASRDFE